MLIRTGKEKSSLIIQIVRRGIRLAWYRVIDSSVSRVSWSLDKRERIRPIGVVSKNATGERSTEPHAALNIVRLAAKLAYLQVI